MGLNPFLQLRMIQDKKYFYGRSKLLQDLVEHIYAGQCCAVVGEHKIGKSSILYMLQNETSWGDIILDPAKYKMAYYDFQSDISNATQTSFWKNILTDLGGRLSDDELNNEIQTLVQQETISSINLKSVLRKVHRKSLKIAFLLDEFDYVKQNKDRFDADFLLGLRSLVNEFGIILVVASRKSLTELFQNWDWGGTSPFPNVFKEFNIGLLEKNEASRLINQSNNPIMPSLAGEKKFILKIAGRHPYVLQRLAYHLYDKKREKQKLTNKDRTEVIQNCFDELLPFFEDIWNEIDESAKSVLRTVASGQPAGYDSSMVRKLIRAGLLDVDDGRIELFSSLFGEFITKSGVRPAISKEQEAAKKAQQALRLKQASGEFDVFLCHNSIEKPTIKKMGDLLMSLGISPWLDEWNLRPGIRWQKELDRQIKHIKSAAVFVGATGLGPWQELEIESFLQQFRDRECPIIPVILPGCISVPSLPSFLSNLTYIDFRNPNTDPLKRLIWGITQQHPSEFEGWLNTLIDTVVLSDLFSPPK